MPPLPPFLRDFVEHIQQQAGVHFESVNVRMVDEEDLPTLPKEILEQILEKALSDENFELATKVRDAINSK
jgi:protein-arginine kinase activator protein McsA